MNQRVIQHFTVVLVVLVLLVLTPLSYGVSTNSVLYWNEQALLQIRKNNIAPPKASRILGLMHVAVFEAVNSVTMGYMPYDHVFPISGNPNIVAEQAAAYVLKHEIPQAAKEVEGILKNRIGDLVGDGEQVAEYILSKHTLAFYLMEPATPVQGYQWEPTAPQHAAYLLPEWCALEPLAITSAKKYRKAGPPAANSEKFASAIDETRRLGSKDSTDRTKDQTQIALFWADGKGTVTPPGHWNQIASQVLQKRGASVIESARVMALLNMAMADAAIVAWDMKYKFQFARPMNMFEEEGWEPLIVTPPFPEYVSGHSTFSGAAAEVLTELLGNEVFETASDGLPGIKRSFATFEDAAKEAGRSRIYGGIHFAFSDDDGRQAGKEIAQDVVRNYFKRQFQVRVSDQKAPCDGTCVKLGISRQ